MDNWTCDEGYKALLAPHTVWGRHFIRELIGEEYVDYNFDAYSLTASDSADIVESNKVPEVYNLYAFCFDESKTVYLTTLASQVGATDLKFVMHDVGIEGCIPSNIVAINILNSQPAVEPATAGVYQCGQEIVEVHFKIQDLASLDCYLDNMIHGGVRVGRTFEYYSKVLMCSVPIMSLEDYKMFYKICYLISSSDAYTSDGVSEDEISGVFESVDTDYLRLLEIAYNTGFGEGRRIKRSA